MKLLIETIDYSDLNILKEDVDLNGEKKKRYKIKGPFLQAETKNRNGRIYSTPLIERLVESYTNEAIKTNRNSGTLGHDVTPEIVPDRISHVIEELHMDKNIGYGVARILTEMPCGKIVRTLIDEGLSFGVSSRGLGSLIGDQVGDDFNLISIDIVIQPSAQVAYVESLIESKSWEKVGDSYIEVAVKNLKEKVQKKYDSSLALHYINEFTRQAINKTRK